MISLAVDRRIRPDWQLGEILRGNLLQRSYPPAWYREPLQSVHDDVDRLPFGSEPTVSARKSPSSSGPGGEGMKRWSLCGRSAGSGVEAW